MKYNVLFNPDKTKMYNINIILNVHFMGKSIETVYNHNNH